MPRISLFRWVVLLGVIGSVFFTALGSARLWDRDEPRNARASHEMLERGDWIVPTFNGQLRDHKPVLLYWSQMCSYLAIGESEFAARLPSAMAALLTVLTTAWLASRLSGVKRGISHEGFWAGTILATCLLFVMAGRAATPDALLIAFSTLGVAVLVVGTLVRCPPYSVGKVGQTRWSAVVLGYASLGVAALAKGPVGILLPLAVVHLWWLLCDHSQAKSASVYNARKSITSWIGKAVFEAWQIFHPLRCCRAIWSLRLIPGLLVCSLVAAPWYVMVGMETDGAFLRGFFWEHNLGRAMHSMEGHRGSLLYYPLAFLVGTFPWSLWLLPVLGWARIASRENPAQRQLLLLSASWVTVYLAAFSCASTKLPSYITPCYAGAALAAAGFFRQIELRWFLPSVGWRSAAYAIAILTGVGISAGIAWLSIEADIIQLRWVSLAGGLIALMGVTAFVCDKYDRPTWIPSCWLAAAVAFHLILFGAGAATVDRYRSELQALTDLAVDSPETSWISIGGMEPSWVYYLGRPIEEVHRDAQDPATWELLDQFLANHPNSRVIVCGEEAIDRLQQRLRSDTCSSKLELLAKSSRFLNPEPLAVFGAKADEATTPTARIAAESKLDEFVNPK